MFGWFPMTRSLCRASFGALLGRGGFSWCSSTSESVFQAAPSPNAASSSTAPSALTVDRPIELASTQDANSKLPRWKSTPKITLRF